MCRLAGESFPPDVQKSTLSGDRQHGLEKRAIISALYSSENVSGGWA
jgi:hypothetical protein